MGRRKGSKPGPPALLAAMKNQEYCPTPEEIREGCERIQAGWTEAERLHRAGTDRETVRQRLVGLPVYARHRNFGKLVLKPAAGEPIP